MLVDGAGAVSFSHTQHAYTCAHLLRWTSQQQPAAAAAAAVSFIGSSFQLTGIILVRSVSQWSGVVSAVAAAAGAGAAAVAAAVAVEGSLSQLRDGSEW